MVVMLHRRHRLAQWVAPLICGYAFSAWAENSSGTPDDFPVPPPMPWEAPASQAVLREWAKGPVALEVRPAKPEEAKDLAYITDTEALTIAAAVPVLIGGIGGAAAAPIGLVYGLYFLVGLPGTAGGMYAIDSTRRSTMADVMGAVDYQDVVGQAIRRRLRVPFAVSGTSPDRRLEVVITAYGFIKHGKEEACAITVAHARVHTAGFPPMESAVVVRPDDHSPDAPPAFCTSVSRLLANHGALANRSLKEMGETVGAIIARRLNSAL